MVCTYHSKIRICRICDNYSSFLLRLKLLTERLVRQGFWYNKLCNTSKKFARRYNVLISKYGVSIRAHVTEGICIPLVAKPDLMKSTKVQTLGGIWRKYWYIWIENNFSCICIR